MEKIITENIVLFYVIIVLLALWTLFWKAWALWKAARNGHVGWFLAMMVVNTLAILEILYIFVFSGHGKDRESNTQSKSTDSGSVNHNMQKPKMVL